MMMIILIGSRLQVSLAGGLIKLNFLITYNKEATLVDAKRER